MTRDKKRKAEARAAQQATGRRYLQAARTVAQAGSATRTFPLRGLLAECATLPSAAVDWGYPEDLAPAVFESALLKAVVPYGTVLELAGMLAQEGTDALLSLESLSPLENAVVSCSRRRLELILSQDRVYELCQSPGCPSQLTNPAIVRCSEHLADCDANALAAMAAEWGYALHDDLDRDNPSLLRVGPEADLLIRAAVAHGAFDAVCTSLLDACFEAPEVLEEICYGDEARVVDMRYAIDRERIRLRHVAEAEWRRIRETADACRACGKTLFHFPLNLTVPPQYCSTDCAPAPAPSNRSLVPAPSW
ncbi:hypothetical protein ACFYN5_36425 [Streptomyces sp. NPDC007126]|uniref:hypothetical protein n=1 Tax=Streptomyces sp. NPDC007126 TaxID=3364774 RepID=UPI0036BDE342